MILKKYIAAALIACGAFSPVFAQEQVEETQAQLPETHEFIHTEYSGFKFDLPAGSMIEQGESFTAKYPDGSFGVSMLNEPRPSKQKYAYEMCRRNVDQMRIKNATVEKAKFGSCAGAIARGTLEGQLITIIVLPYDNQEITTAIIATPNRSDWVDRFVASLKK